MIGDMEFASLLQYQNAHRGKFFAHGAHKKACIRGIRDVALPTGHTVALLQNHLAIARDQRGTAELVLHDQIREQGINPGSDLRVLRIISRLGSSGSRRNLGSRRRLGSCCRK